MIINQDLRDLGHIRAALDDMAEGKVKVSGLKDSIKWIPSDVSEEDASKFVSSIKESYDNGTDTVKFSDKEYKIQYVKEDKTISIKPGIYGKTSVLLGEQVVKTFTDARQARVFAIHLEKSEKQKQKPKFQTSLVKSITSV